MLDEWAGSPPSAGELFRRAVESGETAELVPLMARWETWAAELLESHLSYQVLSYFRSQHENQSWLAALPCPVLRLDGARPLPELVAEVAAAITPAK